MSIAEHSGAVLIKDLPELGLRAGDYGVVVQIVRDPQQEARIVGYLLELFAADGSTVDVVEAPADAVRAGRADDIACVRPVAAE